MCLKKLYDTTKKLKRVLGPALYPLPMLSVGGLSYFLKNTLLDIERCNIMYNIDVYYFYKYVP